MKQALVIRHVAHEGIAGYREPVEAAGYAIERVAACLTDFSSLDMLAPDLLVIMGGPMGVYETVACPWLADEIAGVTARVAANRPTLGVCLGAQIIAAALGARVYPGPAREIGFGRLALSEAGRASPLARLDSVDVLHWHGDTFELPEGADLLASTSLYANQAFSRGPNLLALQFHAEMGEDDRFQAWLDQDAGYIAAAGVDAAMLERDHDRLGPVAVRAGQAMLGQWLATLE